MGALTPLGEGLFVLDGPPARDMGMPFTTRMSVVRLRDGSLWVSSPVPLPFDVLSELASLGPIRYIVSATPRHFWRLNRWHTLFPDAELWSSPITPFTLKRGDLPLTGVLGDLVPAAWSHDLDHVVLGGRMLAESVFFHRSSATLLIEDVIQIHEPLPGHPLSNTVFRLDGVAAPAGGVSRDIRLAFRPRGVERAAVQRILDWPVETVVLAHGPVITRDARRFLENAFEWLMT